MKVAGGVIAFVGWILLGVSLCWYASFENGISWMPGPWEVALAWTAFTLMRLGNAMTAVSDE